MHRDRSRARIAATTVALATLLLGAQGRPSVGSPVASVRFEPERARIGDVMRIEVVVRSDPGTRLLPPAWPPAPPGLRVLGPLPIRTDRTGSRWIHRAALRVQAAAVGRFEWPRLRLEVAQAGGDRKILVTPPHRFEVLSVRERFPGREEPFDLRAPPWGATGGLGRLLLAALAGALGAGAFEAGRALRLRRATPASAAAGTDAAAPPPVEDGSAAWVIGELDAALRASESDPRAGAMQAARALRVFVVERIGTPARCLTSEELDSLHPPFGLARRWETLVRIGRELDRIRFAEASVAASRRGAARAVIEEARSAVRESLPARSGRCTP